jgi:hypothetical protein
MSSLAMRTNPRTNDQPDRQHEIREDRGDEDGDDRFLRGHDDGSERTRCGMIHRR